MQGILVKVVKQGKILGFSPCAIKTFGFILLAKRKKLYPPKLKKFCGQNRCFHCLLSFSIGPILSWVQKPIAFFIKKL